MKLKVATITYNGSNDDLYVSFNDPEEVDPDDIFVILVSDNKTRNCQTKLTNVWWSDALCKYDRYNDIVYNITCTEKTVKKYI